MDPAPGQKLPDPSQVFRGLPDSRSLWEMAVSGEAPGLDTTRPVLAGRARPRPPLWLSVATLLVLALFALGFVTVATATRITPEHGAGGVGSAVTGSSGAPGTTGTGGTGTGGTGTGGTGTGGSPGTTVAGTPGTGTGGTPGGGSGGSGGPGSGGCTASMASATPADGTQDEVVVAGVAPQRSVTATIGYPSGASSYSAQADSSGHAYIPITLGRPTPGVAVPVTVTVAGGGSCQTSFRPAAAPAGG